MLVPKKRACHSLDALNFDGGNNVDFSFHFYPLSFLFFSLLGRHVFRLFLYAPSCVLTGIIFLFACEDTGKGGGVFSLFSEERKPWVDSFYTCCQRFEYGLWRFRSTFLSTETKAGYGADTLLAGVRPSLYALLYGVFTNHLLFEV